MKVDKMSISFEAGLGDQVRDAARKAVLRAVDVRSVDEQMGRDAGALLAKARADDPIDATVVLIARSGDGILTSDPGDIARLASSSGKRLTIISC